MSDWQLVIWVWTRDRDRERREKERLRGRQTERQKERGSGRETDRQTRVTYIRSGSHLSRCNNEPSTPKEGV